MTLQALLLLFIIGLAAGIFSGMIGVGGGIILVPAMVYFLGFSQLKAQGTSLGLLLLPVGALAVFNYYKQGYIDLKIVGIMATGFVLGGFFGSKFSLGANQETVRKIFGVTLLLVSLKMLFLDKPKSTQVQKTEVSSSASSESSE